jgi:plasmid stabilization system protein ParE
VSEGRYVVTPKADEDLDNRAYYYASQAEVELGIRFLAAAHRTFSLIAQYPHMGWRPDWLHPQAQELRLFRVTGFEKVLVLYETSDNGIIVLRVVYGGRLILDVVADGLF